MPNGYTVGDLLAEADKHDLKFRVRWDFDPDPDLSYLDQVDDDGSPLFPDTDKDSIVSLFCHLEKLCSDCGHWDVVESLYGVDFTDSTRYVTGTYDLATAAREEGYQGEIVNDLLYEALVEFLR